MKEEKGITPQGYTGDRQGGLGGHFFGVCASSSRGNAQEFLCEIARSHEDGWKQRVLDDFFIISFSAEGASKSARRSFESQEDGVHLFFTGEGFNLQELGRDLEMPGSTEDSSDYPAQIAIRLYRKHGLEFPSRINGFFSIFMWDSREKLFVIHADRFGSAVPVYYSLQPHGLVFSSQLKMLTQVADKGTEIDPNSLAIFLKYSYVPSPHTILRGVFKLCPGEMIVFKEGQVRNQRYVDFLVDEKSFVHEDEAVEKYLGILDASIQRKTRGFSGDRTGFFLSGGLDSSANVALASRSGLKGFKTFGIGFNDPKIDERPYARIVANHFGVPFSEYIFDGSEIEDLPSMIWHLDEPFMENGLFLTYSGFRAAKGKVDLIIAGDGADQLFGTGGFAGGRPIALRYLLERVYLRTVLDKLWRHLGFTSFYRDSPLFKVKVMLDRALDFNDWFFWGFDYHALKRLCSFPIDPKEIRCFSNRIDGDKNGFEGYYQHASVHQDFEHYVCQNVLVKSFRMAEMSGVLLREAYLDREVIDFLLPLAFNLKTKGGLQDFLKGRRVTKYLHRLAMNHILPEEILKKPKQGGFVPMTFLLGNAERRRSIFDYLTHRNPLEEHLNMGFLKVLLRDYEKCLIRGTYWEAYQESKANQIMNILALSLWCEIIGKRQFPKPPKESLMGFIGN